MQILGSEICTAHNGPSVLGACSGRGPRPDLLAPDAVPFPPESLWGWTEAPAVPATSYEVFDPAVVTFSHPQDVQLCYGPSSTYTPVGSLDPATTLEAPGPGFPSYPTEDFPGQVRGWEITGIPTI